MKDNSDIENGHCASEWGGRVTGRFLFTDDEVLALIAAEREACAKECEQEHNESGEHPEMALHCADRIRARQDAASMARYSPHGRERLWNWFGCSRASWLTMPRVMMHAMPDDWQEKMAKLCEEWDAHWKTSALPGTQVQAVAENGKLTKFPDWLLNYRHPCGAEIDRIRARQEPQG